MFSKSLLKTKTKTKTLNYGIRQRTTNFCSLHCSHQFEIKGCKYIPSILRKTFKSILCRNDKVDLIDLKITETKMF